MGYQIDDRTLRHEAATHADDTTTSFDVGVGLVLKILLVVIFLTIGMTRGAVRQARQTAREHYARQHVQRMESERRFEELVQRSKE